MRIDALTAILLATVVFSSIPLASSESLKDVLDMSDVLYYFPIALDPGLVGLSLTYMVSLSSMFRFCVRTSADVENTVSSSWTGVNHLSYYLSGHIDGVCRKATSLQPTGKGGLVRPTF